MKLSIYLFIVFFCVVLSAKDLAFNRLHSLPFATEDGLMSSKFLCYDGKSFKNKRTCTLIMNLYSEIFYPGMKATDLKQLGFDLTLSENELITLSCNTSTQVKDELNSHSFDYLSKDFHSLINKSNVSTQYCDCFNAEAQKSCIQTVTKQLFEDKKSCIIEHYLYEFEMNKDDSDKWTGKIMPKKSDDFYNLRPKIEVVSFVNLKNPKGPRSITLTWLPIKMKADKCKGETDQPLCHRLNKKLIFTAYAVGKAKPTCEQINF